MKKWESFGWGLLCSFAGGILVAILLYFLYLKKKKVNVSYFVLGFFSVLIAIFILYGTIWYFGFWSRFEEMPH